MIQKPWALALGPTVVIASITGRRSVVVITSITEYDSITMGSRFGLRSCHYFHHGIYFKYSGLSLWAPHAIVIASITEEKLSRCHQLNTEMQFKNSGLSLRAPQLSLPQQRKRSSIVVISWISEHISETMGSRFLKAPQKLAKLNKL